MLSLQLCILLNVCMWVGVCEKERERERELQGVFKVWVTNLCILCVILIREYSSAVSLFLLILIRVRCRPGRWFTCTSMARFCSLTVAQRWDRGCTPKWSRWEHWTGLHLYMLSTPWWKWPTRTILISPSAELNWSKTKIEKIRHSSHCCEHFKGHLFDGMRWNLFVTANKF